MDKSNSLKVLLVILLAIFTLNSGAQEKPQIYDPTLSGIKQIEDAVKKAKKENKHVFIQLGGNWCPWCILFHNFCNDDPEVKSLLEQNFVTVKLNYSPENKNEEATKMLENPGRFGYPVFIILDQDGRRIHTQNSAYLEEGRGYDRKKVIDFLKGWSPGSF